MGVFVRYVFDEFCNASGDCHLYRGSGDALKERWSVAALRNRIASAAKSDGVCDRLKKQICHGDVLETEHLSILNAALSSGEGDASACGFKAAKSAFSGECERQVELAKRVVVSLGNGFMFLDAAFGEDSWEVFIHLTKLSIDPTAARLVSEYGLAEFMRHNKGLLFEGRGFDLLKEIKIWMTYFGISGLGLRSLATVCAGVRF